MDLHGKVALVTGGSSGIGRAAAAAFAEAGAHVVIATRGRERGEAAARGIAACGGSAVFVRADVSVAPDVEALVAQTVERFGRLDYALNNAAAIEEPFAATADVTEEQFDRAIELNLKSVWLCMRQEIRQMLTQDPPGGAIVNTSSVNGLGGVPNACLYAAAKAGVIALAKSAAIEYSRQGIRVNALVAGAFDTPMLAAAMDRATGGNAEARAGIEQMWTRMIPTGRIGRPEEAGAAAVWLCSDAASFLTGHSLIVDGGLTSLYR
jgi:NAD(P)-dependent dehydrogenase (short-subunit alcohol dehydrogenase family)